MSLACVSVAAGCDLSGLVDIGDSLLDPDNALLDHPGRQLVEGHYSGLKIAGSSEGGGYVLAQRHDGAEPSVAVVPFLKGSPCEYSPAFAYDRFSSRVDLELPGTISVQVDQNETNPAYGTVRFIDYDCEEVIDEVPDTALPGPLFPGVEPFGMLARSTDGTLYMVDAKRRTSTLVAPLVDYGVVAGAFLFTLEGGEIVVRNEDLEEVERMGAGVTALIATGGDVLPLVYQDSSGMHAWSEGEDLTSLGENACQPWYIGLDAVAYYDPCDQRRLAVHATKESVFGSGAPSGLVTLRGPGNARIESLTTMPSASSGPASLQELIIVTPEDAAVSSGDLLGLTVPEDAAEDEPEVQLQGAVLAHNVTYVPYQGVYYKDYADGRGTLLDLERNDDGQLSGVLELAEDVAWVPYGSPYTYRGILAGFDGTRGKLVRLTRKDDDSIERELLGEEVPLQDFVGDRETEVIAYVSEVNDDGLGILTVIDEFGPSQVADDVMIGQIRLLDDPRGVVFLRPAKGDAFELHTWLIEAELDLTIHEAASEYIAIPWPSPGVLYAVPEGDDAGLWFAKAR